MNCHLLYTYYWQYWHEYGSGLHASIVKGQLHMTYMKQAHGWGGRCDLLQKCHSIVSTLEALNIIRLLLGKRIHPVTRPSSLQAKKNIVHTDHTHSKQRQTLHKEVGTDIPQGMCCTAHKAGAETL